MTDEARRTLNRLVAERVLGYEVDDGPYGPQIRVPTGIGSDWDWGMLPDYAGDIRAAWEVVDKLRQAGWLAILYLRRGDGGVRAAYQRDPLDAPVLREDCPNGPYCDAVAPTAPEAICRAALQALGVEVPV